MPGQLDQLVEKLRKALGPDLVSVVLYGSAAVGDHDEKFSDYNVLCVLSQITPAQLGATETIFRWWREQGNPAPLLLTEHEVRTSTDCFAIEFQDIKEHHRILYRRRCRFVARDRPMFLSRAGGARSAREIAAFAPESVRYTLG